ASPSSVGAKGSKAARAGAGVGRRAGGGRPGAGAAAGGGSDGRGAAVRNTESMGCEGGGADGGAGSSGGTGRGGGSAAGGGDGGGHPRSRRRGVIGRSHDEDVENIEDAAPLRAFGA